MAIFRPLTGESGDTRTHKMTQNPRQSAPRPSSAATIFKPFTGAQHQIQVLKRALTVAGALFFHRAVVVVDPLENVEEHLGDAGDIHD